LSATQGDRPAEGTVLAVDYGERRIGVAVGELALGIAHPLTTVAADSDRERLERLAPVVNEWNPVLIVVGLPTHPSNREHPLADRCRRFAQKMGQHFKIPVRLVDERLTSNAAEQSLTAAGVPLGRRKQVLDRVAAQSILETFFASHDHIA
jgi:putative Holliday junction resolvase